MWDSFVSHLHAKNSFVRATETLCSEYRALWIEHGSLLIEGGALLIECGTLLSATCMQKTLLCAINTETLESEYRAL